MQHSKLNANSELKCVKCNGCMLSDNHDLCVLDFINNVNARNKSKSVKKSSKRKVWKPTGKVFTNIGYTNLGDLLLVRTFTLVEMHALSLGYDVPSSSLVGLLVAPYCALIGLLRFMGLLCGRTWTQLILCGQFYLIRKHRDMMTSSLYVLVKSLKTKFWLWHCVCLILNFGAINHLARHGLVRDLPKLKFEKDHLCPACAMGKSKKKPHKHKSEDTNQEKLYLLHMDLCGPMRVTSINGKKYIIVIVDDYSRFTWVQCLRSKDEAPDFIIKFLKMIQVRLKVPVQCIRTDNGTEFVNQTLCEYYEKVGISHETSVARSPKQNVSLKDGSSSGPALYEMTPATISLGLMPNLPPSTPFVPSLKIDGDLLVQPLLNEITQLLPPVLIT
ncbi:retrovirus-related pol polyprotein from transposon TNT 1-94 [Tanacetum coccineum]